MRRRPGRAIQGLEALVETRDGIVRIPVEKSIRSFRSNGQLFPTDD